MQGALTGSQKSVLRPYDSFIILAVILSKWTGSLRPSRLMTNITVFARGNAPTLYRLGRRLDLRTEASNERAAL